MSPQLVSPKIVRLNISVGTSAATPMTPMPGQATAAYARPGRRSLAEQGGAGRLVNSMPARGTPSPSQRARRGRRADDRSAAPEAWDESAPRCAQLASGRRVGVPARGRGPQRLSLVW